MATKTSMWVLFGTLVISALILGPAIQVGAETMKFKFYTYVTQDENAPIGDVEGHKVTFSIRRGFCVFENGEVATEVAVATGDNIKGSGSSTMYRTITFSEGSTIIMRVQITVAGSAEGKHKSTQATSEIIKGTGRFEGIKGTGAGLTKFLPAEKGEVGAKTIGEGTLTYTLPSK
jgi:hypothetical protein